MTEHDPAGGLPHHGEAAGLGRADADPNAAGGWLTPAEISRALNVSEARISKAIRRAKDTEAPLPPHTVDPVTGRRKFQLDTFEPWLRGLPGRGRPRKTSRQDHRAHEPEA